MSSISEDLARIQSAIYGKDVRQSIHDAIQTCYSDVSSSKMVADGAATNANTAASAATTAAATANSAADAATTTADELASTVEDFKNYIRATAGLGVYIVSPTDVYAAVGDTVRLTVGVIPAGAEATYQWQNRNVNAAADAWNNSTSLTGAKEATIIIPVTEARQDKWEWRCVVTIDEVEYYSVPCIIRKPLTETTEE